MKESLVDITLMTDFLKYALAVLKLEEYINKFRYCDNFGYISEFNKELEALYQDWINKPLYNSNKHSEFSPNLSETEVNGLKDPDLFTKEELVQILNTLIIKYLNWEELLNERFNRHSDDNAIVSNTLL